MQLQRWLDRTRHLSRKRWFESRRRAELGSGNQGAGALPDRREEVERRPRLDDRPRRRRCQPAAGRRRHPVSGARKPRRPARKSTLQQKVTRTSDAGRIIAIEPVDPGVVCNADLRRGDLIFDPWCVAICGGPHHLRTGTPSPRCGNGNYWNWRTGAIFPPVWPGYLAWPPILAGVRRAAATAHRRMAGDRQHRRSTSNRRRPSRHRQQAGTAGLAGRPGPNGGRPPGDRPGLPGGGNIGNDLKPRDRVRTTGRPRQQARIGDRPTTRPAPQPDGGQSRLRCQAAARGRRPAGGGGAVRPPLPGGGSVPLLTSPIARRWREPAKASGAETGDRPAARPPGPRPPNGSAMSGIGMGPGNQMFSGAASEQMGLPGGMRPGGMAPNAGGLAAAQNMRPEAATPGRRRNGTQWPAGRRRCGHIRRRTAQMSTTMSITSPQAGALFCGIALATPVFVIAGLCEPGTRMKDLIDSAKAGNARIRRTASRQSGRGAPCAAEMRLRIPSIWPPGGSILQ